LLSDILLTCTKKPDTLELNNVEIEDKVENLTIEEYKHVTKEKSQKAFEQLLNRFQNLKKNISICLITLKKL